MHLENSGRDLPPIRSILLDACDPLPAECVDLFLRVRTRRNTRWNLTNPSAGVTVRRLGGGRHASFVVGCGSDHSVRSTRRRRQPSNPPGQDYPKVSTSSRSCTVYVHKVGLLVFQLFGPALQQRRTIIITYDFARRSAAGPPPEHYFLVTWNLVFEARTPRYRNH